MRPGAACAFLAACACLAALVAVPACGYREIRYELAIEDPPPGGGGVQQARVEDKAQKRQIRADRIRWRYSGVLVPGPKAGEFTATGPGTGSVEAEFVTPDGSRSLAIAVAVAPRPGPRARIGASRIPNPEPASPEPSPTPEPAPTKTPDSVIPPEQTPTPSPGAIAALGPSPTPEPALPSPAPTVPPGAQTPKDGDRVLEAYRLAGESRYAAALEELAKIRDPGFGPKVQTLTRQWSPLAGAELATAAERLLAAGKTAEALDSARKGLALSPGGAVRARLEAVQKQVDH